MKRLLRTPLLVATKRKKSVVAVSILLLLLSLLSISRLGMDASYLSLLPRDDRLVRSYGEVIEKIGQVNGVTVVAQSTDLVNLIEFTKIFLLEIQKNEGVVLRFLWPIIEEGKKPIAFDRELVARLSEVEPKVYQSSAQGLVQWLIGLWDFMLSKGGMGPTKGGSIDEAINPLIDLFDGKQIGELSIAISITPRDDGLNVDVLKRTYTIANQAAQRAKKGIAVTYGLTGIAALAHDEEQLLMSEVFRLGTAAFVIIVIIFILFSGSMRLIPIVFLPLISGTVIGLGLYGFRTSSLNMVTAVFPVMIFGLGIDYALYLISEIAARQRRGLSLDSALQRAYLVCMGPIAASALTTAAAFFALSFANFAGIAELGLLAGVTILTIAMATLTLLPLLVTSLLSEIQIRTVKSSDTFVKMSMPRLLTFVVTFVLLAYGASQCKYNDDLLAVQPPDLPSRLIQSKLGSAGLAESIIIFCPTNLKEETTNFLEKDFGFSVIELSLSSDDISQLTKSVRVLKTKIAQMEMVPQMGKEKVSSLLRSLDELKKVHEEAWDLAFAAGLPIDEDEAKKTGERIEDFSRKCSSFENARNVEIRAQKVLSGCRTILEAFTREGGTLSLLRGLVERTKGYELLIAKGNRSIWHGGAAQRINTQLAKEGLTATGPVLIFQRLAEIVRADAWRAIFLAALAVFLTLLITFRSFGKTLAALAPLLAGYLAMAGGLGLLGIPVTIGNVAAFPLLFGIGIDYGIHIVDRTRRTDGGIKILGREGLDRAMFVAAATTLTGFLALACSRHPGLSSFGIAVAFGIGGSAVTARLISPHLLPTNGNVKADGERR